MSSRGRSRSGDTDREMSCCVSAQKPSHPPAAPHHLWLLLGGPILSLQLGLAPHSQPASLSAGIFTAQLTGECSVSPTLGWPPCKPCGVPSTSGPQNHLLPQPTRDLGTDLKAPPAATVWGILSRGEDSVGAGPQGTRKSPRLCWDPGTGTGPCTLKASQVLQKGSQC